MTKQNKKTKFLIKKFLEKSYEAIVFWVMFMLTLLAWIYIISAWDTLETNMITPSDQLKADSWSLLTADKWNTLVQRVSNIYTDADGKVGIGRTSPTAALDVNGKIKLNNLNFWPENSSRTINLDNSMTATQIQAEIDWIGKYITDWTTITLNFAVGTYNLDMKLTIAWFMWPWTLTITWPNTWCARNGFCSSQTWILDFRGTAIWNQWLLVKSNTANVNIKFLRINKSWWTWIRCMDNLSWYFQNIFIDDNTTWWTAFGVWGSSWTTSYFYWSNIKWWGYGITLQWWKLTTYTIKIDDDYPNVKALQMWGWAMIINNNDFRTGKWWKAIPNAGNVCFLNNTFCP